MAYGETVGSQEVLFSESRGIKLGAFAELGGSLDFFGNWLPAKTVGNNDDPYTAAARIMAVAGYLENTRAPLEVARQIAIEDTKEHFSKEEDPEGEPWPQLSEDYAAYKSEEGYPDRILVREGNLEDAATSQEAWVIIGEVLVFDPLVLPQVTSQGKQFNYGAYHQGAEPRREHLVGPVYKFEKGKGLVETGQQRTTFGVPPRPFIGLSDAAMAKITAEFERWFAGAEVVFGGEEIMFGSNVGGTFPVIGHTQYGQPRLSTGQFGRK